MSRLTLFSLILIASGLLLLGFQSIQALMGVEIVWKEITLEGLMNSAVLEKLNVGDVFDVKLYQGGDPRTAKSGSAQVRHITRQSEGRYQGHYLVGLSVPSFSEQEEPPPEPA